MSTGTATPEDILTAYRPEEVDFNNQPQPLEVRATLGEVVGGDGYFEDFESGLREYVDSVYGGGGPGADAPAFAVVGGGPAPPAALVFGVDWDETAPRARNAEGERRAPQKTGGAQRPTDITSAFVARAEK